MDTHRDEPDDAVEGRFVLLTGPGAAEAASALAARLPRAATVDGTVVGAMFATAGAGDLERTFLRYTAGIALADSFRLAGFDAVVAEDVPEEHIEAYLEFAAPTTVHLVRLGAGEGATAGLRMPAGEAADVASRILDRIEEAAVETPDDDA